MYEYCGFDREVEESIQKRKWEIFFTLVIILATCLIIYITLVRIRAERENRFNQRLIRRLGKIAEVAILLILISTLFFAYFGWEEYKKNPTEDNLAFLIATLLVVIAATIRYATLLKANGTNLDGPEDIVG